MTCLKRSPAMCISPKAQDGSSLTSMNPSGAWRVTMKQNKQDLSEEKPGWKFICDRCGKHNQCAYVQGKSDCWCMHEAKPEGYKMYSPDRCLCPSCFKELQEGAQ